MQSFRLTGCALTIIAFMSMSPPAHADGSVSFEVDVVPILKSRPLFAQFIQQTFSVADAGWAVRIGGPTMPKMRGARIGPYRFQATWHAPQGDTPVTLVIDTKARFFDEHHREILGGDLRKATSIAETLNSIEIEPPRSDGNETGTSFHIETLDTVSEKI
jgi:hypothetical protein